MTFDELERGHGGSKIIATGIARASEDKAVFWFAPQTTLPFRTHLVAVTGHLYWGHYFDDQQKAMNDFKGRTADDITMYAHG